VERLLHHHPPNSLATERLRPLSRLVRLDLELLVFVHHVDEPLVRLMACEEAVGRREPERHLGGREVRVGVLAADGQAGYVGQAVKLRAMIGRCDGWMGLMGVR